MRRARSSQTADTLPPVIHVDRPLTLGLPPGNNDDEPMFMTALGDISSACARAGIVAGIHSTGALTSKRVESGFRMVTVTADIVAMRIGLAQEMYKARVGCCPERCRVRKRLPCP